MHINLQPLGDTRFPGTRTRSRTSGGALKEPISHRWANWNRVWECSRWVKRPERRPSVCQEQAALALAPASAPASNRRTFAFNAGSLTGCVACGGFCVCPTCTQEITARHAQWSFRRTPRIPSSSSYNPASFVPAVICIVWVASFALYPAPATSAWPPACLPFVLFFGPGPGLGLGLLLLLLLGPGKFDDSLWAFSLLSLLARACCTVGPKGDASDRGDLLPIDLCLSPGSWPPFWPLSRRLYCQQKEGIKAS